MTYLFLDTEWADPIAAELVSLALISETGEHRFYAERDPLPPSATDFVRHVVYPLLDRGHAALPDVKLSQALRMFLSGIDTPMVIADYPSDLALLRYALAGFDLPDAEAQACGPIPRVQATLMDRSGLVTVLLEEWFTHHPEARARRHHAGIDAEALRQAWLAATGRTQPEWAVGVLALWMPTGPEDALYQARWHRVMALVSARVDIRQSTQATLVRHAISTNGVVTEPIRARYRSNVPDGSFALIEEVTRKVLAENAATR